MLTLLKESIEKIINDGLFPWPELLASRKVVVCTGNPKAKILVVGRDLGEEEILYNEVLVGRTGSHFRKRARQIGFDPLQDFLMTNTVPLRPLGNKAFPDEVRKYFWPVLGEIVAYINPKFILTLGNEALRSFVDTREGITKLTGKTIRLDGVINGPLIIPLVHPSYVVRGISAEEEKRHFVWPLKALYKMWKIPNN